MTQLSFRTLTPEDIDALVPLHQELVEAVKRGFLDPRPRAELQDLLTDGVSVNVGLFDGPRMIGYSLAKAVPLRELDLAQNLVAAEPGGELVATGRGMGVLPEYRGRRLGTAAHAAHADAIRAAGMVHYFGRIVVDNFVSVLALIDAATILHGFDRDRFGTNFAYYSGALIENVKFDTAEEVSAADLNRLGALFRDGLVAHACRWRQGEECPMLALARMPAV